MDSFFIAAQIIESIIQQGEQAILLNELCIKHYKPYLVKHTLILASSQVNFMFTKDDQRQELTIDEFDYGNDEPSRIPRENNLSHFAAIMAKKPPRTYPKIKISDENLQLVKSDSKQLFHKKFTPKAKSLIPKLDEGENDIFLKNMRRRKLIRMFFKDKIQQAIEKDRLRMLKISKKMQKQETTTDHNGKVIKIDRDLITFQPLIVKKIAAKVLRQTTRVNSNINDSQFLTEQSCILSKSIPFGQRSMESITILQEFGSDSVRDQKSKQPIETNQPQLLAVKKGVNMKLRSLSQQDIDFRDGGKYEVERKMRTSSYQKSTELQNTSIDSRKKLIKSQAKQSTRKVLRFSESQERPQTQTQSFNPLNADDSLTLSQSAKSLLMESDPTYFSMTTLKSQTPTKTLLPPLPSCQSCHTKLIKAKRSQLPPRPKDRIIIRP